MTHICIREMPTSIRVIYRHKPTLPVRSCLVTTRFPVRSQSSPFESSPMMVSKSYRSVLEAEVLRDYRLPRSASFCSRHLVETRPCAGVEGGEGQTSPRKLGKRASSRKLVLTKVIEVPLKQADSGTCKERARGNEDLRRKGSTRLLSAGKESRRKQSKEPSGAQPNDDSAEQRKQLKQAGKDLPRNADLRKRASSKRLTKAVASTRKLVGTRTEFKPKGMEPAQEIAFVPDRVERKPEKLVASILYGSGRAKSLALSRSVTFIETESVVCREFEFDADEYEGFPEVPSYEHLDHDEYYEAMAEIVAELSGSPTPRPRHHEFTVCHHAEEESAEFTVCFAETTAVGGDIRPETPDSAGVVAGEPQQKQQDLKGDSSTASDTVPSSQDDASDETYLPEALKSPKPNVADNASLPPKASSAEAVIPRTVIYQSPETKKRRRSALSVMKRTLKIISL
jgi:hypothetical protein